MHSKSTTKYPPNRRKSRVYFGACEWCEMHYPKHQNKHRRFCSNRCAAQHRAQYMRGENHPTYKGRVKHYGGYMRVWWPGHPLAHKDGYVQEHRLVLYEAGVDVPTEAHVHHINGDKGDNHPRNLEVLAAGDHHRGHIYARGYIENQYGVWPIRRAR